MSGIPGLQGSDHIGITVPDLDEAERFFIDVIGAVPVYTLGAKRDDDGDWMRTQLGVHPRTVIREIRFLRARQRHQPRALPLRRRRRPEPAAPQQRHRRLPPRALRRRPGCRGRPPARARCRDHGRARRQRGRIRRASAGSISAARGVCSSSWSATPAARPTRRTRRSSSGTPRTRQNECRDDRAADPRGCGRAHRIRAARGDPDAASTRPATGCDRRTWPTVTAPAAFPCARRCACSRPRAW